MAEITITEFTDPGCPWAYSAEPSRLRLTWLYGEHVQWRTCMVGLADSPQDYESKGFTPERQAKAFAKLAHDYGMPIDTREPSRMAATMPACRAVVAARLHAPEHERGLLRRLRVHHFSGGFLDAPETLAAAARDIGLDPDALREWMADPAVEEALQADLRRTRKPSRAALALDHKLADWSGGRRYTCPSYEITSERGDAQLTVPGFQPLASYEVALANLMPDVSRRPTPTDVREVLAWAGTPLASQEVAVLLDTSVEDARQDLGLTAHEAHVGADGFWSLAG